MGEVFAIYFFVSPRKMKISLDHLLYDNFAIVLYPDMGSVLIMLHKMVRLPF